jgi:hypothetical protein
MDATTAFETLTDLIDANKDKMADYDYMKMMDCMKTMFEKNSITQNITEPIRDFRQETILTDRNYHLTQRFYEIYTARSRCSNCGNCGHSSSTCKYNLHLIDFEEGDDYGQFSLSVLINKKWYYNSQTDRKSKDIYDLITMSIIGIVSDNDLNIGDECICKIINGEYHYFSKRSIKDLGLMDTTTTYYMRSGMKLSSTNNKNKYFDK